MAKSKAVIGGVTLLTCGIAFVLFRTEAGPSATIGAEKAPTSSIPEDSDTFRALLTKRVGTVSAEDFRGYARRLIALCRQVIPEMGVEISYGGSVPVGGAASFFAGSDSYEPVPGVAWDAAMLEDDTAFAKMFNAAPTVILDVGRKPIRNDAAWARMEWVRRKPRSVYFYGQQIKEKGFGRAPLEDALYRRMFHVPGSAPNLNFAVRLGWDAEKG